MDKAINQKTYISIRFKTNFLFNYITIRKLERRILKISKEVLRAKPDEQMT